MVGGAIVGVAGVLAAAAWPDDRPRSRLASIAIVAAVATLLAAPLAWSATTSRSAVNGVFPGAGPNFVSGLGVTGSSGMGMFGGGRGGFGPRGTNGWPPAGGTRPSFAPPTNGGRGFAPGGRRRGSWRSRRRRVRRAGCVRQLGRRRRGTRLCRAPTTPGSRWTLIVSNEQEAASYVIKGKRVASMGGFTGRETVLTPSYLSGSSRPVRRATSCSGAVVGSGLARATRPRRRSSRSARWSTSLRSGPRRMEAASGAVGARDVRVSWRTTVPARAAELARAS